MASRFVVSASLGLAAITAVALVVYLVPGTDPGGTNRGESRTDIESRDVEPRGGATDHAGEAVLDPVEYAILTSIVMGEATSTADLVRQRDLPEAEVRVPLERFLEQGVVAWTEEGELVPTERGVLLVQRIGAWLRGRGFDFDSPAEHEHPGDATLVREEPGPTPEGMVWIRGGVFRMGDRRGAPDKHPDHLDEIPEHQDARYEHEVALDGFWMDEALVTNRRFAEFVEATGYVTRAERGFSKEDLAAAGLDGAGPAAFDPGSLCFNTRFDAESIDKTDPNWVLKSGIWTPVAGADWRHPEGPQSNIEERMDHPVVHVSWDDAVAFCEWAGRSLPTEAQWEYAARGGLEGQPYPWGSEPRPGDDWPHNIWQGNFPFENAYLAEDGGDGYLRTSPVRAFPPNRFGLYDMTGNVWEWCADNYRPEYYTYAPRRNPAGPRTSFDPREPDIPKRAQRGGSFMCSDTYCIGYSVASRMAGDPLVGSFHCGFRTVLPAQRGR